MSSLALAEKVANKVKETGRKAFAVQTDVRIASECQELVDRSLKEMGRIDIFVCGAGVGGLVFRGDSEAPLILENISEEEWDLTIDVNLKGVFLCNRAIAPYFKGQTEGEDYQYLLRGGSERGRFYPPLLGQQGGRHRSNPSGCASTGSLPCQCQYGLSRGHMDAHVGDRGQGLLKNNSALKGMTPEQVFQAMVQNMTPLRRPQTPEDIGNAVVFLASEEAKEITGQAINVDGGAYFS